MKKSYLTLASALFIGHSQASILLTNGLVAYYDMEGLTNKASALGSNYAGPNYDLTISGTSPSVSFSGNAAFNSTGATGSGNVTDRSTLLVGNAANFSHVGQDRLNTTYSRSEIGASMSIGMWFFSAIDPNQSTVNQRYFTFEAENNFDLSFGTGNTVPTATSISQLSYFNQTSSGNPETSVGQWHHVMHTISDLGGGTSTFKVFINGTEFSSQNLSNSINSGFDFSGINIGNARNGQARGWDGMIDEVVIYNRALNTDEVKAIYDLGAAGQVIPEPGSLLLGASSGLLALLRRRR